MQNKLVLIADNIFVKVWCIKIWQYQLVEKCTFPYGDGLSILYMHSLPLHSHPEETSVKIVLTKHF